MRRTTCAALFICSCGWVSPVAAQSASNAPPAAAPAAPVAAPAGVVPPPDYVVGPDDVLTIVFWKEKDMSSEVVVRPDGKIALPLLNDVHAAGLTPDQLRDRLAEEAKRYLTEPAPTVVVKQINSRKVFITGEVQKPGPYPLLGPTTVIQLIATAGGLKEFANGSRILIMRIERGRQVAYRFNYKDVLNRKNLRQNIDLKPGDTVIVP
jgi:polysaccharide biosynthesis/export protein